MKDKRFIIFPQIGTKNNILAYTFGVSKYHKKVKDKSGKNPIIMTIFRGKNSMQPILEKEPTLDAAKNMLREFKKMSEEEVGLWINSQIKDIEKIFSLKPLENLSDKNNEQLLVEYVRIISLYELLEKYSPVIGILNLYTPYFPNYLRDYLKLIDPVNFKENYSKLTRVEKETIMMKEEKELNELAKEVKRKLEESKKDQILFSLGEFVNFMNNQKDVFEKITEHSKNYGWMGFTYNSPGFDDKDYIKRIYDKIKSDSFPEINFTDTQKIRGEKKELMEELIVEKQHQVLFEVLSEMIFNHTQQQHGYSFVTFLSEAVMKEIGNRLGLTSFETRYLLKDEVRKALRNEISLEEIKALIKKREDLSIFCFEEGDSKFLYGDEARKYLVELFGHEIPPSNLDFIWKEETPSRKRQDIIIKGSAAHPGKVEGEVIKLNGLQDLDKMQKDKILVSPLTVPQLLPAMLKAKAIITDTGGVTSHAAIVSREFEIPCIVGTGNATEVLNDGDFVEVDAYKEEVKIIKRKNEI